METGYRVTSDLRIKAEPEEDILSLTCIAKSHGHNQEVMTTKTNIQVMVLSKYNNLSYIIILHTSYNIT